MAEQKKTQTRDGSVRQGKKARSTPSPRSALLKARRGLSLRVRLLTSGLRMEPDLLVIGAQKAGTTSLFRYLVAHPRACEPVRKEIGFFTSKWDLGMGWYRAQFPLMRPGPRFALEASTGYLDYPHAPARVAQALPGVRLIVLVRDPVERAWSHFRHSVRLGVESLDFATALMAEESRTQPLIERMTADPGFYAREVDYYSYLRRGRYAQQIEAWLRHFPREQILILPSEELYADPRSTMERVWAFLEFEPFHPPRYAVYNKGQGIPARNLDPALRQRLDEHFAPHNLELERLLGRRLPWQAAGESPPSESANSTGPNDPGESRAGR